MDLIRYWQSCVWRNFFSGSAPSAGTLPENSISLDPAQPFAPLDPTMNGAHWVVFRITLGSEIWSLLWLPVALKNGHFQCRQENNVLPWIPNQYFLPASKIYLKSKIHYEDFLKFDYLDSDGEISFDTVQGLFDACQVLLHQLLEHSPLREQILSTLTFMLVTESDLPAYSSEKRTPSAVLKRYADLYAPSKKLKLSAENFLDLAHAHLVEVSQAQTRTESDYLSLLALISLKKGDVQAIRAPLGTKKVQLINEYVANIYCVHALGQREKPHIVLLGEHAITLGLVEEHFKDKSAFIQKIQQIYQDIHAENVADIVAYLHQHLLERYEKILKIITLARTLSSLRQKNETEYGDVHQYLAQLSEEDEAVQDKRLFYIEVQNQWRSKLSSRSLIHKCISWMHFVKQYRQKQASAYLKKALTNESIECQDESQLVDQIRALKVIQAKNDQKRIQAVAFLNQIEKAQSAWDTLHVELCHTKTNNDLSFEALNTLLSGLRKELWQLSVFYWQGRALDASKEDLSLIKEQGIFYKHPKHNIFELDLLKGAILHKKHTHSERNEIYNLQEIEYLLIDGAEHYTPTSVIPILNISQRAIFLGDHLSTGVVPLISGVEDEAILKQISDSSEDVAEHLQMSGAALSYGNALKVAERNSIYHTQTKYVLTLTQITNKSTPIFDFWNKKYFDDTLTLSGVSHLSNERAFILFKDVKSKNSQPRFTYTNEAEADAILEHIQNCVPDLKDCIVITPFYEQRILLEDKLSSLFIRVYDFFNLPTDMYQTVIFSPVVGTHDLRPFLFDEGDSYFYQIFSLAKAQVLIVGDLDIFQKHRHSPSGDIAMQLVE